MSLAEITNDDPHRASQEPDPELVTALLNGAKFAPLLTTRSPGGRLVLLGGERRYNALREVNRHKTQVYVAHNLDALIAWLTLDASDVRAEVRMARSEVAAFGAKAAFLLRLNVREISRLDILLADLTDYDKWTIQNTRQMLYRINKTPPGIEREQMMHDLALVNEGILAASSAISRATGRRKAEEYAASAVPADQQARTLKRVLPGLRGTVEGLRALGAVSGEIPEDLRNQAEKELREAYRLFAGIVKDFKIIRESA